MIIHIYYCPEEYLFLNDFFFLDFYNNLVCLIFKTDTGGILVQRICSPSSLPPGARCFPTLHITQHKQIANGITVG